MGRGRVPPQASAVFGLRDPWISQKKGDLQRSWDPEVGGAMLPTPVATVLGTLGVRVRNKTSSLLYREPLSLFIDAVGVEFVF